MYTWYVLCGRSLNLFLCVSRKMDHCLQTLCIPEVWNSLERERESPSLYWQNFDDDVGAFLICAAGVWVLYRLLIIAVVTVTGTSVCVWYVWCGIRYLVYIFSRSSRNLERTDHTRSTVCLQVVDHVVLPLPGRCENLLRIYLQSLSDPTTEPSSI